MQEFFLSKNREIDKFIKIYDEGFKIERVASLVLLFLYKLKKKKSGNYRKWKKVKYKKILETQKRIV